MSNINDLKVIIEEYLKGITSEAELTVSRLKNDVVSLTKEKTEKEKELAEQEELTKAIVNKGILLSSSLNERKEVYDKLMLSINIASIKHRELEELLSEAIKSIKTSEDNNSKLLEDSKNLSSTLDFLRKNESELLGHVSTLKEEERFLSESILGKKNEINILDKTLDEKIARNFTIINKSQEEIDAFKKRSNDASKLEKIALEAAIIAKSNKEKADSELGSVKKEIMLERERIENENKAFVATVSHEEERLNNDRVAIRGLQERAKVETAKLKLYGDYLIKLASILVMEDAATNKDEIRIFLKKLQNG